jgi:hypothetical protein
MTTGMIVLICLIPLLVGVVFIGWLAVDDESTKGRIIGFIVSVICTLALMFVLPFWADGNRWAWESIPEHKIYDIYSLKPTETLTSGTLSGTFFIGTGSVHSEQYYFFYAKEGEGYRLEKEEADSVLIVESDSMSPCLTCKADAWKSLEYRMYVPVGTIEVEYNL